MLEGPWISSGHFWGSTFVSQPAACPAARVAGPGGEVAVPREAASPGQCLGDSDLSVGLSPETTPPLPWQRLPMRLVGPSY